MLVSEPGADHQETMKRKDLPAQWLTFALNGSGSLNSKPLKSKENYCASGFALVTDLHFSPGVHFCCRPLSGAGFVES